MTTMMAQVIEASQALDLGLIVAAFAFGLRHGIDWDHIAAITDITASQDSPRAGMRLGTVYVLGHAAVVFGFGLIAILLGGRLPPSFDEAMGKVVGVTLVVLGVYVVYSLLRHGRDFRLQSRWMLALRAVRAAHRWLRARLGTLEGAAVLHEHAHVAVSEYHHEDDHQFEASGWRGRVHAHAHTHADPGDPSAGYGTGTALMVGALHGIGAETPTQVLIFLAAAGAGGPGAGLLVLAVFLLGLATSNSLITVGSAMGFLAASRRFAVYASLGALTGLISLGIGITFLLGREATLPAILGG
jgi:high-affinity nickel-transport protein